MCTRVSACEGGCWTPVLLRVCYQVFNCPLHPKHQTPTDLCLPEVLTVDFKAEISIVRAVVGGNAERE